MSYYKNGILTTKKKKAKKAKHGQDYPGGREKKNLLAVTV